MSTLFGTTQNSSNTFGAFGGSATQQQQNSGTGLFGSANTSQSQQNNNQTSTSFGGIGSSQPQQSGGRSLFGNWGSSQQQQSDISRSGLFAGQSNSQQQQQNTQSSSLFGAPQQQQPQQTSSLFGSGFQQSQQPQQQQQQSFFGQKPLTGPSLGGNTFGGSNFGSSVQQPQSQPQLGRSIWQQGSTITRREKSIPDQMQTLVQKWSPDSSSCLFQHYFYNSVPAEQVPYYGPGPDEDESKWEEALSKKPSEDTIPVLCVGFQALGSRLRVQVQSVAVLEGRLHEINNSLTAMLQTHEQDISVRASDANRRHLALSQRCLQLAAKIQVLRNRGYAMDGAEEELRKRFGDLDKQAFDPQLHGRQEEIWAKMVYLRDKTRLLQSEMGRYGSNTGEDEEAGALDEGTIERTKKILGDYDTQIHHLESQLEDVQRDFEDWEKGVELRR